MGSLHVVGVHCSGSREVGVLSFPCFISHGFWGVRVNVPYLGLWVPQVGVNSIW